MFDSRPRYQRRPKRATRSLHLVEPDYRLCRRCRSVWNLGRNECPPHLQSLDEMAKALDEASVAAA